MYVATDATPIDKSEFRLCLYKERENAITSYNIQSGWRSGGLWPLNPQKPLRNERLLSPKPKMPPQVPPSSPPLPGLMPMQTSQNGTDVFHFMRDTEGNQDTRYWRYKARKLGKQLGKYIFQHAADKARIQKLETQLEKYQQKKKALVKPNPSDKFVDIENVMAIKERMAKEEEARKKGAKAWAKKGILTTETNTYPFESVCFQWQLITKAIIIELQS